MKQFNEWAQQQNQDHKGKYLWSWSQRNWQILNKTEDRVGIERADLGNLFDCSKISIIVSAELQTEKEKRCKTKSVFKKEKWMKSPQT